MTEQPGPSSIEAAEATPRADGQSGGGIALDLGPAPDAAEIAQIEQLADPVLRNLQITLGYCRLSREMGRLLGPGNANWCTFATWASKRAGQSIRADKLRELRERICRRLEHDAAYHDALSRLDARLRNRRALAVLGKERIAAHVDSIVNTVSVLVAEGNLKVFAELAPAFSQMIASFDGDAQLDPDKLSRFVSRFRSGPTTEGGQDLLRAAFTHYGQALFEQDPKAKAELILLANDQVGLHEQTRLQPNIAGALDAPIRWLRERIAQDVKARLPVWKRLLVQVSGDELLEPLLTVVTRIWREEATRLLMHLPVPGEVLGLGWDVPPPPGQRMFPGVLQELQNQELIALLREYDRTWNTTAGSGAADWASLGDRMNYIADLFRARQQDPSLYDAPFTADQCRAIREGRVPEGKL